MYFECILRYVPVSLANNEMYFLLLLLLYNLYFFPMYYVLCVSIQLVNLVFKILSLSVSLFLTGFQDIRNLDKIESYFMLKTILV